MSLITRGMISGLVTRGMGYVTVTIPVPPSLEGIFPGLIIRPTPFEVKIPVKGTLLVRVQVEKRVIGTLGVRLFLKIQIYGTLGVLVKKTISVIGTLGVLQETIVNTIGILSIKTSATVKAVGQRSLRLLKMLLTVLEEDENDN